MLGRKTYTQEELDTARGAVDAQLAGYRNLVAAIDGADPKVRVALEELEPELFNALTLALDRHFVHRLRVVTGKDSNPLNEVELMADSLLNNGGVLRANNVIKLKPEETVLQLAIGDPIRLSVGQFEQLANAFLAEIEAKFV